MMMPIYFAFPSLTSRACDKSCDAEAARFSVNNIVLALCNVARLVSEWSEHALGKCCMCCFGKQCIFHLCFAAISGQG